MRAHKYYHGGKYAKQRSEKFGSFWSLMCLGASRLAICDRGQIASRMASNAMIVRRGKLLMIHQRLSGDTVIDTKLGLLTD